MKPKYRNINRILPAVVSIALSLPFVTQAAIFNTDDAGNATPTVLNNGATTIRADGGILPLNPNPLVNIIAGVSLTGDAAETEVVEITAANYTVTNAGSLAGSAHDGINSSTFAFTLNNSGIISAAGGNQGVFTLGLGTTITNNSGGTISGTDKAIWLSGNGGTVINSGLINGITGATSDGIFGDNGVTITNNGGGTIQGLDNGIDVLNTLNLTNNYNATITGINAAAVFARVDATINNFGSISGGTDGINVSSGAIINNKLTVLIGPDAGGSIVGLGGNGVTATTDLTLTNEALGLIRGSTNGIVAGDGGTITTNVTNSAAITGLAGDGIQAQNSFVVVNNASGVITGTGGTGVWLNDDATVTNNGTITGTNTGLRVGEGSTVTNTGTISGNIGIDASDGFGSFFNLTNSGTITGLNGIAIYGVPGNGVDTYLLNAGSLINGSIRLKSGDDVITMTSSNSASSIVNGYIDGGSNFDTLNFVNGMTSAGGSTNRVSGNIQEMEDINKTGSGTAFVLGNVNSDTIDVTGGALYIVGSVDGTNNAQSAISANAAGIGGTGIWDANITLTNGATISPGQINLPVASTVANSIGTLTVTGDVTLSSTSAYVWNATPGLVTYDRIVLTGSGNTFTTNNSDFVISPTNVNSPLIDGNRTVVDTADTLVGNFDSITVASFPGTTPDTGLFQANQTNPIIAGYFSTLTKVNGSQDWQLTIEHDYSQFGSTDNEVAAGEMLNGLVNTATGDVADLLAAMDYSDESYTEDVLAALDPGAYMAAVAGLANNNYHLHRTVENHNAAVRAGSGGTVMTQSSEPSAKGAMPTTTSVASGCSGTSNVWGSFSYDWQDLETSNSSFDQDGEVYAFTAGIDFTVAENFRLGIVAEGSQSDWDGDLNLGSEVESYRFAGYANWGAATGWFVDALIGYNTHSVDQSRSTFFGNESADYDADGWQGLVNVGYAVATSAGTFSPYLGLEWQQLSADSFDDSSLPISVGDYDIDSFRALAGVRWEAELAANIVGYASATYAFEFEDDAAETTVGFGGGSYRATGLEQGDSVLVSAGIRWGVATCTTIDMGYRGEFAMDDGIDSNGANIGLNYSF